MIRLIAAIDQNRGLARNGQIPWRLPEDTARYRALILTFGANILIGRTTYEAMGYLKGSHYYVVSHSELDLPEGCTQVKDLESFLADFSGDLWVVGGEHIYSETIQRADELYLTLVDGDFKCDQFFPDYSAFKLKESEGPFSDNQLKYSYNLYSR